jgi:5-methylcytosine-specific restriction endonuclease McrA
MARYRGFDAMSLNCGIVEMDAVVSHKQCRCCSNTLPSSMFYRRQSNKDGLYSYCKACTDEKGRAWRNAKPNWTEHKREYDRARVYRLSAEISAQNKKRYKEQRKQKIASATEWAKANPERKRAIGQSYKHRRRSIERAGIGGRELAEWRSKQENVCYWCGDENASLYTVDHFYPLAKGGGHEISNLVLSCKPCNLRKNAKDPYDFAKEIGRLDILEHADDQDKLR